MSLVSFGVDENSDLFIRFPIYIERYIQRLTLISN